MVKESLTLEAWTHHNWGIGWVEWPFSRLTQDSSWIGDRSEDRWGTADWCTNNGLRLDWLVHTSRLHFVCRTRIRCFGNILCKLLKFQIDWRGMQKVICLLYHCRDWRKLGQVEWDPTLPMGPGMIQMFHCISRIVKLELDLNVRMVINCLWNNRSSFIVYAKFRIDAIRVQCAVWSTRALFNVHFQTKISYLLKFDWNYPPHANNWSHSIEIIKSKPDTAVSGWSKSTFVVLHRFAREEHGIVVCHLRDDRPPTALRVHVAYHINRCNIWTVREDSKEFLRIKTLISCLERVELKLRRDQK